MTENISIRVAAKMAGVSLWRVARALGVSEPTLYRWLREPLQKDREEKIMGTIRELSKEAC